MKPIAWGWLALGGGIVAYLIATSSKAQAAAGISSSSGPLPAYRPISTTAPTSTSAPAPAPAPAPSAADQAAAEQQFLQGLSGSSAPFPTGG